MTDELLKMIESVSPNDTAKLDEIDARVWCWLNPNEIAMYYHTAEAYLKGIDITRRGGEKGLSIRHKQYTRNRGALKAIRPEGSTFHVDATAPELGIEFVLSVGDKDFKGDIYKYHPYGEELAELHAIIQAIAHNRSQQ